MLGRRRMAKTRLCSSSTTIIIGVNAVKESSIMGSEKDHNSPVKNCAFPMPKLQSSLLFAEQVTIRSVPGTPTLPLQSSLQLCIQRLFQFRVSPLLKNLYENQFIRSLEIKIGVFADHFVGFVLSDYLVSDDRFTQI